ncbi:MAG: hypothetical protein HQL50_04660 [Magnetococcales bacterium]|nr:hypothetical protein [Magnetococcales bacterium]
MTIDSVKDHNTGFSKQLNGRFDGMIRLEDIEQLKEAIALHNDWFLIEPGEPLPETTISGYRARDELTTLVDEILEEERGVWSTMVYVQSKSDPHIVKVFHPRRAGCGCGAGGGIKPWRVLTRVQPEPVAEWETADSCTPQSVENETTTPPVPLWKRLFKTP